jgi:hypothetical protein
MPHVLHMFRFKMMFTLCLMMGNTSFGFTLTKPPRIQLHAESSKANNKQPDCRYRSWPPCKWCVVWKKALHCQCYWLPITSTSRLMSRSFNLCKSRTFWVLEKEKLASKLQTVIAMKVETYNSRWQIAWFPFLFDQKKQKKPKKPPHLLNLLLNRTSCTKTIYPKIAQKRTCKKLEGRWNRTHQQFCIWRRIDKYRMPINSSRERNSQLECVPNAWPRTRNRAHRITQAP